MGHVKGKLPACSVAIQGQHPVHSPDSSQSPALHLCVHQRLAVHYSHVRACLVCTQGLLRSRVARYQRLAVHSSHVHACLTRGWQYTPHMCARVLCARRGSCAPGLPGSTADRAESSRKGRRRFGGLECRVLGAEEGGCELPPGTQCTGYIA